MWVYPTAINRIRSVEIQKVKKESPTVKTFTFHDKLCGKAKPGQFIMVWVPGVDEVPMSLSTISTGGISSITVAEVGETTRALHQREVGDFLEIRGPFGNGFTPISGNVMIVGGGTGLAPLMPLAQKLMVLPARITFLLGAKTKDDLLFLYNIEKTLSEVEARVIATTEDGSYGLEGLVTEPAEQFLKKERFDTMYVCGSEQMIYAMFVLAKQYHTPIQASLERLMRCAIGLCGSCMIGRFRVCKDGPVFSSEQLDEARGEFGRFKRAFNGRKVAL